MSTEVQCPYTGRNVDDCSMESLATASDAHLTWHLDLAVAEGELVKNSDGTYSLSKQTKLSGKRGE